MRKKIASVIGLTVLSTYMFFISHAQLVTQNNTTIAYSHEEKREVREENKDVKKTKSETITITMPRIMSIQTPIQTKELTKTNLYQFTDKEMDLLYHVVFAEAGNQSEETIGYVTSVIINRVYSDLKYLPDTLEEVIMQDGQFQVVTTGVYLEKEPDQKTIDAVNKICYETGVEIDKNVLAFRNSYYFKEYEQAFRSGDMYFSYF